MKVYTVLSNTYDYYRFTDYIGTYSSLTEARKHVDGRTYVINAGEDPWDEECEKGETVHYIIVSTELGGSHGL